MFKEMTGSGAEMKTPEAQTLPLLVLHPYALAQGLLALSKCSVNTS